jgi:ribose/xylose/arabinose/galactoside ABC-type transport system permease subunit
MRLLEWRAWLRRINRNRVLFPITALTVLVLVAALISPHFLTPMNIKNVLSQVAIMAVLAAGEACVILTGGIDLSVGSVLALGGSITAVLMKWVGLPIGVAIIGALGMGLVVGLINGALVAWVRIPSFIATLAMMAIARGATLVLTGGKPVSGFAPGFRSMAGYAGPFPLLFIIALGIYVFWQLVLSHTRLGRYIYAVGGNELATRFVGVDVRKVKLLVFVFSGICAALGGVMLDARLNAAYPTAGEGYELDAIAAAVLGGVSFSGGIGSLVGTFIGALVMTILGNILNLLKVAAFYQYIAKGLILAVAAVSLSRGTRFAK